MIDHIGQVYTKNDSEFSRPNRMSVIYEELREDNEVTNYADAVYIESKTTMS